MKNIYFGIAFTAILALSACSDDDSEPDNNVPSSSSGPISHISPACYVPAKDGYFLCWETVDMTETICGKIADKYKDLGAMTGEFMTSCPDEGLTTSCSSPTGEVNAYIYGQPVMPTCQLIVNLKIDEL